MYFEYYKEEGGGRGPQTQAPKSPIKVLKPQIKAENMEFVSTKEEADVCLSNLKLIVRTSTSFSPKYGAELIDIVLSDPELLKSWKEDLILMSSRINEMRVSLHQNLKDLGSKRNWDHIKDQIGMFAYTGLNKDQVLKLRKEKHIYFTDDGRISISGLNTKNVKRVAECFHEITKH